MKKLLLTLALGLALLTYVGCAENNASATKEKIEKCGAGKCGGADKKASKCGAGKCDTGKKAKEAAKCGAGKCGGN